MYSSDNNQCNPVQNELVQTTAQLSVPSVTLMVSPETNLSTPSKNKQFSQLVRPRSHSVQIQTNPSKELSNSTRRASLAQPKFSCDITITTSFVKRINDKNECQPSILNFTLDNNNNQTVTSSTSETSTEYSSVPQNNKCQMLSSSVATQNDKSLKDTLLDNLQDLKSDELPSKALSPTDRIHLDDRIRTNIPRWKSFAKVVTCLLTFSRTKQSQYEWVQLVGHRGTFKEGLHDGFILKALSEKERRCCELIQNDILKDFVPKYNGVVKDNDGRSYIEIEDLLARFEDPCIMDCKIGVRTYLEEDLNKSERDPEPRSDLYEKMIDIDPTAPTEKEHAEKKILKPRYMIWRESLSSTQELGFRIEAIKKFQGLMSKEFQKIKRRDDVKQHILDFIGNSISCATNYLSRLTVLRSACLQSEFFRTHELIGSSLLFVHDANRASAWMIDFGKTRLLPNNIHITHSVPWIRGTHEDGYLIGLNNLILLFQEIIDDLQTSSVPNDT